MEKLKLVFLVLLTAATLVIVSGCSKNSKGSNPFDPVDGGNNEGGNTGSQASVTINGEQFDNIHLNVSGGASYYLSDENSTYTSIVGRTGSDSLLILLAFTGKGTGTFEWNDSDAISYLIIPQSDKYITYVSINSGSTTITEYGKVNEYVKGNFSGSVYDSETNEPVDITGTFSIKRIEDR